MYLFLVERKSWKYELFEFDVQGSRNTQLRTNSFDGITGDRSICTDADADSLSPAQAGTATMRPSVRKVSFVTATPKLARRLTAAKKKGKV